VTKVLVMIADRRMKVYKISDEITVSHASVQSILKGELSRQRVRDICARNLRVFQTESCWHVWPVNARSRPPISKGKGHPITRHEGPEVE
jgi:hypothetical protein